MTRFKQMAQNQGAYFQIEGEEFFARMDAIREDQDVALKDGAFVIERPSRTGERVAVIDGTGTLSMKGEWILATEDAVDTTLDRSGAMQSVANRLAQSRRYETNWKGHDLAEVSTHNLFGLIREDKGEVVVEIFEKMPLEPDPEVIHSHRTSANTGAGEEVYAALQKARGKTLS